MYIITVGKISLLRDNSCALLLPFTKTEFLCADYYAKALSKLKRFLFIQILFIIPYFFTFVK